MRVQGSNCTDRFIIAAAQLLLQERRFYFCISRLLVFKFSVKIHVVVFKQQVVVKISKTEVEKFRTFEIQKI